MNLEDESRQLRSTWEGGLLEGGAGLGYAVAMHMDLAPQAVRRHVRLAARRHRGMLHIEVLLKGRQAAEVLLHQLDGVYVIAAAAAAAAKAAAPAIP